MPNIGPMIAASAKLGVGYASRLLNDVTAEQFARFAKVGDTVIESNHPSFILGHLSLYAPRIIEELGGDPAAITPMQKFQDVFTQEVSCVDDVDGTVYPAMDEVTKTFFDGYEAAIKMLNEAEDELFLQPNPNESMRKRFENKGAMHGFYVGGHVMMHMGQLSAWRRAAGLGPA